jgi:hypothetical protein
MEIATSETQPVDDLHAKASDFAKSLGDRLARVLDGVPDVAVLMRAGRGPGSTDRLHVAPRLAGGIEIATIPLTIGGRHRLNLRIEISCTWDRAKRYLTVDDSKRTVETLGEGTRAQPLFRFEYDRMPTGDLPVAHIHVHAHRDEITWMMTLGDRHRARQRTMKGSMPVLSELHLPVGGHRFRFCVEDVLEMLILEFGVETRDANWRKALNEGRAEWRRMQVGAAVRDSQEAAAEALREAGWQVLPPPDGVPPDDMRRLTAR